MRPERPDVPRLSWQTVRTAADRTREALLGSAGLPIDIDLAIENRGIRIIPSVAMRQTDLEAMLAPDLSTILVRHESLTDDVLWWRSRFSLAHELGHVVLHGELLRRHVDRVPPTVEEWIECMNVWHEEPGDWMEAQANEFAGRFLVPVDQLQRLFAPFESTLHDFLAALRAPGWDELTTHDRDMFRDRVAHKLHRAFELNQGVVAARLRKESLLP